MALTFSRFGSRLAGFVQRRMSEHMAQWPYEARLSKAIISFSFDDFPRSALAEAGAILREHGAVGTYYTSLGLMNKEEPTGKMFSREDLDRLVAEGHELGCHTYSHCHSWQTKPADFEAAIVANQQALAKLLPGVEFKTLSYPISSPRPETKRRASAHFACCRGGGQTFNTGAGDRNHLKAFFLEQSRDNLAAVTQMIDLNERERGWLIFATHDVCVNPTRYGCAPSFFEAVVKYAANAGAVILPVFTAWQTLQASCPGTERTLVA